MPGNLKGLITRKQPRKWIACRGSGGAPSFSSRYGVSSGRWLNGFLNIWFINEYLRCSSRIRCFSHKGSMASGGHLASERHAVDIATSLGNTTLALEHYTVIPVKETVSYRFITIRVGATAIHQMPKGVSWLIAKSNHLPGQARRRCMRQDAYVDQRRLCACGCLSLFLDGLNGGYEPGYPAKKVNHSSQVKACGQYRGLRSNSFLTAQ